MKRHNLHNHSTFSDGLLEPAEIVEIAKEGDLDIIGISDHAFTQKLDENHQLTEHFEEYLSKLRKLQKSISGIQLLIGAEIDVLSISPFDLPFDELNNLDYVLFEYVNDGEKLIEVAKVREKFDIPVGLAHNDLQGNFPGLEDKIAELLAGFDIYLDLNQSEDCRNCRKFQNFYELFSIELLMALHKRQVKVAIGTDSHTGEALCEIDEAYKFILKNQLTPHPMIA